MIRKPWDLLEISSKDGDEDIFCLYTIVPFIPSKGQIDYK
jgi:hypothetical protein